MVVARPIRVSRPADIAQFHWELHHGNIVSKDSLDQMLHFVPMKTGWSPQLYGLGLMHTFPYQGWPWQPDPANDTFTIGHAGADYGSLVRQLNSDIILDHFSRVSQHYASLRAPCDIVYFVPTLMGC